MGSLALRDEAKVKTRLWIMSTSDVPALVVRHVCIDRVLGDEAEELAEEEEQLAERHYPVHNIFL